MAEEGQFADPIAENPESWREHLPEDIRGEASLEAIKDFPSLVKSYVHAQKLVGANKVVVPGEAATEEELDSFYKAIGRPEKPDEYGLKAPDELPEDFPYSDDLAKGFSEQAHKLGLNAKQVQGLYNWYMQGEVDAFTGLQKDREEDRQSAELTLRKEFGKAYDEKIAAATNLVRKYADEDTFKYLQDTGLGNDPRLVKLMANISKEFSEDRLKGDGTGQFGAMSPAEAQTEIRKLQGDKDFSDAYMNRKNPAHADAVQRMQALFKLAYPEPQR